MKKFTGDKWWDQPNPAYREACRRDHSRELIELKGKFDYFIKYTYYKTK